MIGDVGSPDVPASPGFERPVGLNHRGEVHISVGVASRGVDLAADAAGVTAHLNRAEGLERGPRPVWILAVGEVREEGFVLATAALPRTVAAA